MGVSRSEVFRRLRCIMANFDRLVYRRFKMKSKHIVVLAGIIFLFFAFVQVDKNAIVWSENYKVNYDDFKARPDASSGLSALTYYSINCSYHSQDDVVNVEAYCYFDKSKSWIKVRKDSLLAHERLHFDIAELYTRKLKAYIATNHLKAGDIGEKVNAIYKIYLDSCYLVQNKYDEETRHSLDAKMQKEWSEKIKSELQDFDAFKKKDLVIKTE
jgi:hypothetical protein